jgi:Flp pilus assembly protein TadG
MTGVRGFASQRGSTAVESALVGTVFLLLLAAIMEFGRLGFTYNSVSFAAHRAARFAAVRGSASGHPAAAADVKAEAQSLVVALDTANLAVTTTWTPDNHPGSTVKVKVSYPFHTLLVPVSSSLLTLTTTSTQVVTQ